MTCKHSITLQRYTLLAILLLLPLTLQGQIREYRLHDRGMLHETVYNTGDIGRPWQTGNAGNVTTTPLMEWPSRSATTINNIKYSGQHNLIGGGVYVGANIDSLPGEQNRLFALCGGVGASTPEQVYGVWSFPLFMEEIENFPVLDDGSLNPNYDPDEAEEIISASWSTPTGITITRTSRAWSYPDYDDLIIYEYTCEYTGDTDGDLSTIEMDATLNDVMFLFQYGFAPSMYGYQRHYQEWKYTGGIYRGDQNNFWDLDYWLSFNMNLRTNITNNKIFAKPEPDRYLFEQYAQSGENGGGLASPQAPGYCVLHYDTTHLAIVIPEELDSLGLNESEAQNILGTSTVLPGDPLVEDMSFFRENENGTFTWWYEVDSDGHIKQPWSNKVSTGNTNSLKMMYEKDSFNPNARWSGVYKPGSTTWANTSPEWYGRAAYPYRQSADAGMKHHVFGPYTLEPGDKLEFAIAEVVGYGAEAGKLVEGGQVSEQWSAIPSLDRPVIFDGDTITHHYLTDYGYPDYINSESVINVTQVAHKAFRAYLGNEPIVPVWPENHPKDGNYQIPVPVPAPAIVIENTDDGMTKIKWSRDVESFQHPRLMGELRNFIVFRSKAGMGPWEPIDTVLVGENVVDEFYEIIDSDETFAVGDSRYYSVTSQDIHGNQSGKTNIIKFQKNIGAVATMEKVHVVPNPYRLSSGFDRPLYAGKIGFYGLPAECTIRIFSYAGQLVNTIKHNKPVYSTEGEWLQITRNGQDIASGVYFFVVTSSDNKTSKGKFVVLK
tara:strand:+ start:13 stop:2334 length:2322 start_codon:yes stop_codon:yes gene_type:complete